MIFFFLICVKRIKLSADTNPIIYSETIVSLASCIPENVECKNKDGLCQGIIDRLDEDELKKYKTYMETDIFSFNVNKIDVFKEEEDNNILDMFRLNWEGYFYMSDVNSEGNNGEENNAGKTEHIDYATLKNYKPNAQKLLCKYCEDENCELRIWCFRYLPGSGGESANSNEEVKRTKRFKKEVNVDQLSEMMNKMRVQMNIEYIKDHVEVNAVPKDSSDSLENINKDDGEKSIATKDTTPNKKYNFDSWVEFVNGSHGDKLIILEKEFLNLIKDYFSAINIFNGTEIMRSKAYKHFIIAIEPRIIEVIGFMGFDINNFRVKILIKDLAYKYYNFLVRSNINNECNELEWLKILKPEVSENERNEALKDLINCINGAMIGFLQALWHLRREKLN